MRIRVLTQGMAAMAVFSLIAVGCTRNESAPTAVDDPATMTARPAAEDGDDRLATYVQARYQGDVGLRKHDIGVSADNGVVTLRGTVDNAEARQRAEQMAQQVAGVSSVKNQLQVRAPAEQADLGRPYGNTGDDRSPGWITTKIQSQYFTSGDVRPWDVDVTTNDGGVVTLRGEVEDQKAKAEAERIARQTDGVTSVNNQIRIVAGKDAERAASTMDKRDMDQRAPEVARADGGKDDIDEPDAWVTAKIQAKYFMDDDVKGHEINVDTNEGVVTLRGEVESEAQRRQAVALARNTEGVKSVTDQLKIVADDSGRPAAATGRETEAQAKSTARDAKQTVDDTWVTTKIQSKFFLDSDVKGRDINVDTKGGVVTLAGTVHSDAERRTAEAIARETPGVAQVVNQLKVDTTERR